jgi:hypothetical protein
MGGFFFEVLRCVISGLWKLGKGRFTEETYQYELQARKRKRHGLAALKLAPLVSRATIFSFTVAFKKSTAAPSVKSPDVTY